MPNSRFPQLLSTVIHHGPTLLSWQNDMCHLSNGPLPRSPVLGAVPPSENCHCLHSTEGSAQPGEGMADEGETRPLTMPLKIFLSFYVCEGSFLMTHLERFVFIEVIGSLGFYKWAYVRPTQKGCVRAHAWLSGISQNPNPSLFPSSCPSFCLSRGLHEWIGALSLSHDSKEHYWRWMLLKKRNWWWIRGWPCHSSFWILFRLAV